MWSLFAQLLAADDRNDPLMRSEVVYGILGLTAALLVGAIVIYSVDKWRKRAETASPDADAAGALSSYRDMYENGEITEEEYAELRRRVAEKVKKPPAPKPGEPGASPGAAGIVSPPPPPSPPAGPTEPDPPPSTA
jgi:hypothetical protein